MNIYVCVDLHATRRMLIEGFTASYFKVIRYISIDSIIYMIDACVSGCSSKASPHPTLTRSYK